ncbi:ribosomal protein L4 (chloroplast) [Skeletonema marinoi]|jgi:large subunit ribosomal protein L4|uniref:Large ribosomal subunit protein uL4c n=1 Tax=Skeletonema marinoi TaxID=267567 RepID=A0A8K1GXJ5_9STRA|nr:ribosomal protein L4 [Skeletonema marinoi]KAK1732091.1 ribosomal protein L4 [Skeletonema marinoi]UAM91344.1 ribosomal protein L4 [Skeletonema marinoi]|mmetsp:Transcript_15323/g.31138  ORF Transcript_15323/g.31138 Transcript_15323/m.31138 type:complete len:216 (+) Transcript_15323:745-1392(+)
MAVQKIIEYNSLDSNGQISSDKYNFTLNILEDSGNYLIHRDILRHQLSQKQGTVSTKTRSEVRGGGKKPWQQKGTGRARAGSNRSPLWRGGGVIFGPKPRTINLKLNKKERNLALQTLLYNKRNNISVIGELETLINEPKTKVFCDICNNYNINLDQKILLVVSTKTTPLKLATKNLKNVELISASHLNTLSLLKAKQILLTPLAVNNIKEIYCD